METLVIWRLQPKFSQLNPSGIQIEYRISHISQIDDIGRTTSPSASQCPSPTQVIPAYIWLKLPIMYNSQKPTQTAASPSIINMIWEIVTTAGIQFDPTLDHFYELIDYFSILKEFSKVWIYYYNETLNFKVFSADYLCLRLKFCIYFLRIT